MDLGSDLRAARERAGLSLPELAARTRIPLKSLRAIEENDFARVPPGIFARGFVRSYALEVGIDPIAAVAQYRALTEPVAVEPAGEPKDESLIEENYRSGFDPELLASRPGWGYALIAAALLIGVISVNKFDRSTGAGSTAEASTPVPSTAGNTSAAPKVSPQATQVQAVGTAGTGLRVDLRAEGVCWINALADGETVYTGHLQPGDTQSITGRRDVVIRIGDPAALSYSINGKPGQPLGAARVPVTARFSPDGQVTTKS